MVFSSPGDNFYSGQLYFGGSASLSIDLEDSDSDMVFYFNPEVGTFVMNNLLFDMGIDLQLSGSDAKFTTDLGMTLYLPLGALVPYVEGQFSYTIIDDFYYTDGSMSVRAICGLDLFISDSSAVFMEVRLPRYYLDYGAASDWMYIYFGLHFYAPFSGLGLFDV